MKRVFLGLLACFLGVASLKADEVDEVTSTLLANTGQGPLFVSLGADCTTAGMIKHFGKRQAAFPLDWLLTTDEEGVVQMLNNNFQDFVNKDYLVQHPVMDSILVHSLYHIEFFHDWTQDWWPNDVESHEEIEKLQTKFQRRIARFQQLANYKGTVCFIRLRLPAYLDPERFWFNYSPCKDEKECSQTLYKAIKNLFPNLDFKLIVVTKTDAQNKVEIFDDIVLCHFASVIEHRNWELLFSLTDLFD